MKRPLRLLVELLEDRLTPAAFGFSWPDPAHLTVSLVKDGTAANGSSSALFQTLNGPMSTTQVWETEILRALQTWAVNANINIGLVADGSQDLGAPGLIQGDPRFGDIRISALPLGSLSLSSSVPFSLDGGSWSGDIQLNSGASFGIGSGSNPDLYSIVLHEAGHVFGLDDNLDPTSAMFAYFNGVRTGLSAADVQALQAIYGVRGPDAFEGKHGNDSLADATAFRKMALAVYRQALGDAEQASDVANLTPLTLDADLSTSHDLDFYRYRTARDNGNFTVQLQTSGISLLEAKLTVLDSHGQVVQSTTAVDPLSGDLSIRVDSARPHENYFIKVESATSDMFGIGAYRLKVVPDSAKPLTAYNKGLQNFKAHPDNNQATATNLGNEKRVATSDHFDFLQSGALSSPSDVDFYKLKAPNGGSGTQSMTVMVWAHAPNELQPTVTVYDASGKVVAAEVVVNGDGNFVLRVANVKSGATYFVSVQAADAANPANSGAYTLGIDFSTRTVQEDSFASGTITAPDTPPPAAAFARTFFAQAVIVVPPPAEPGQQDFRSVQVAEGSVLHLEFSASTPAGSVETSVEVTLFDRAGNALLDKTFVTGTKLKANVFLAPGDYTIRLVAGTKDGSRLPALTYSINGTGLNEPIGPPLVDPNAPPPPRPLPFTWLDFGLFRFLAIIDPYGRPLPLIGG